MAVVLTIVTKTMKEAAIDLTEYVNKMEICLMKDELDMTFEQAEQKIDDIIEETMELEWNVRTNKEVLFYTRLLLAKCEEVKDIIELKQAM